MKKIGAGLTLWVILPLFFAVPLVIRGQSQMKCDLHGRDTSYVGYAIKKINDEWNGVPKGNLFRTDISINEVTDKTTEIMQVNNWEVLSYIVQNGDNQLLDDDPVHSIYIDFEITYEDGTKGKLSWNTWNYGRVVCPLIVRQGSGPPGYIQIDLYEEQ